MKVNDNVKKALAIMAIIEDTEEQIKRTKSELEDRIRTVKAEFTARIENMRRSLKENHAMLTTICGPEYDAPRVRSRNAIWDNPPTSNTQEIRARVTRFIGEEILKDQLNKEENGQALPSAD